MQKIRKVFISAIMAITLLPKKIFAYMNYSIDPIFRADPLYGIPTVPFEDTFIGKVLRISKIFIIPLVLVIGFVLYFKKSKSTTKRKIITMIIVLLIVIAIYLVVGYLIKLYFYDI